VFENFLLDTYKVANLPAKQGYQPHRMLDFARMGSSKGTGITITLALLFEGALLEARPDRQDITRKVRKQVASSYKKFRLCSFVGAECGE
jgi:hypothetical protein